MAILENKDQNDTNSSTDINTLSQRAVDKNDLNAKGDIYVASADNTLTTLPIAGPDLYLEADSSTPTGLKWSAVSSVTTENTPTDTTANVTTSKFFYDHFRRVCVVYESTGQNVADNTFTNLPLDGTTKDPYSTWTAGTPDNSAPYAPTAGKFEPNIDGDYFISATIAFTVQIGDEMHLSAFKNGGAVSSLYSSTDGHALTFNFMLTGLLTTDDITFQVRQRSGGDRTTWNNAQVSHVEIFLVNEL